MCAGRGRIVCGHLWSPAATHVNQCVVRAFGEGGHRPPRGHRGGGHCLCLLEAEDVATASSWVLKGEEAFSGWRSGGEEVELKG